MKSNIRQGLAVIKGNHFGENSYKIQKWASYTLIRKKVTDPSGYKFYRHVSVNWWGANKYMGCTLRQKDMVNVCRFYFTTDVLDRIID